MSFLRRTAVQSSASSRLLRSHRHLARPAIVIPHRSPSYTQRRRFLATEAPLSSAPSSSSSSSPLPSSQQHSSNQWAPNSALKLTQAAMDRLHALRVKENNPRLALRVTVESGGCHGYQYHMDIEELPEDAVAQSSSSTAAEAEADEFADEPDEWIAPPDNAPSGSLPFLVTDPMSLKLTRGATVHFATELIGSTFRIEDNPQAKGAGCGCGVSWELKDDVEL